MNPSEIDARGKLEETRVAGRLCTGRPEQQRERPVLPRAVCLARSHKHRYPRWASQSGSAGRSLRFVERDTGGVLYGNNVERWLEVVAAIEPSAATISTASS